MEINTFIREYENVLSEEYCDALCKFLETQAFTKAGIIDLGSKDLTKTDFEIRRTYQYNFVRRHESMTHVHHSCRLHELVKNYLKKYAQDLNIFDLPISGIQDITALKYEAGGFYTWHVDHCAEVPRTFSFILLLNDKYEGGELCFRNPNKEKEFAIVNKKGKLIIWPSNFMYPHTVKPLINGTRYSVVSWVK